jgi:hypothetical protein
MKFEIVEPAGAEPPADDQAFPDAGAEEETGTADPFQALKAGTARLASGVQAEAQQISECVAEMADLAALATGAGLRQYDRASTVRPPASFRAARFGGARERGPEIGFAWPETGSTD